jgi:hypothetical protein
MKASVERGWIAPPWIACAIVPNAGSLMQWWSYRPASEWIESEAPAIIAVELFEKAQLQLQRNAEVARKMYQPTSRRYLLRTLVKCGKCGLGRGAAHRRSVCKKYE